MKTNISLITALVILWINLPHAMAQQQSRAYEGNVTIDPVRLEQHGEMLHIEMDFIMHELKVKSARGIDFIPLLTDSERTMELPRVSVKGRDEYLAYERNLALMTPKELERYPTPYRVEKGYERSSYTIGYRYIIPYELWMENARLDIRRDECGCGETELMTLENVFEKVTPEKPPYVVIPHMAYVQPVAEAIKSREKQIECFLDFEVNKTNIRPEYMNNPRELDKIKGMIDELGSDPDIEIDRLDIIGYASPEGTLEGNRRLSEGRAMALRDYLAARYEFPRSIYHIVFGGENWVGLRKALQENDIEYKNEILDIIDRTPSEQVRKNLLKQFRGGVPYRYLLANIYPALRVAVCKANYHIKNFNVEEAKDMIRTRPQNLSLNEMFHVANTYPKGSQEFVDVFETAVRMYPQDDIANLNAAASALSRNDTVSAGRYLSRVRGKEDLPEYKNIAGVLALLKEDFESAEKLLKEAAAEGLEEGRLNLLELSKKKESTERLRKRELINKQID